VDVFCLSISLLPLKHLGVNVCRGAGRGDAVKKSFKMFKECRGARVLPQRQFRSFLFSIKGKGHPLLYRFFSYIATMTCQRSRMFSFTLNTKSDKQVTDLGRLPEAEQALL
jgi:hypothetical protein